MEEIKALVRITANDNKPKQLFPKTDKSNKEGLFYSNLLANRYDDDRSAAQELYGASPNDVRYKMLKYRLKRKLYNNLFFYDYDRQKLTKSHQKEQECLQLLHHAHLLLRLYEADVALALTAKVKNIAEEYEYLNFTIDALELEMVNFSNRGELTKFNMAKSTLEKCLIQKRYEREAITLFQSLRIQLKKSIKTRRSNLGNVSIDLERLKALWGITKSFEAFNAYYKANIIYHEMTGNFSAIVDLTLQSENLLKLGEVNSVRFDSTFNKYILVYAHLRAKKLEKGLEYAAEYISVFDGNSPNWFAYMENYFLLALHSKKYQLVDNLLHKVLSKPAYAKQSAPAKERWTLYQAYFVLMSGHEFSKSQVINPFLFSLPEYSKDKEGFNVAILILQFIYYLQKKETESLLYRIESLKKYILTHLRDTFSLRSKIFLKLLILIVTQDFELRAIQVKGQKLYQKLQETPTPGDAYAEIEIVPYEHLWEHILNILEAQYR